MRLNLNEIIEMPGGSVPFQCELDDERLMCPSVEAFETPTTAEGTVRNNAGALTLTGVIHAKMRRICDRCMDTYEQSKDLPVEVPLSTEVTKDSDPDLFPVSADGWLDLSDLLETCFILDMDAKSLCKPDCAGLCPTCGANLNYGKCSCRPSVDPRFAVLGQLLDIDE